MAAFNFYRNSIILPWTRWVHIEGYLIKKFNLNRYNIMARLLGVDIPNRKKIEFSLRYIYGVGPTRAKKILEVTGIDPDRRTQELNEQEISLISNYIIDQKIMVEGDLRRAVTNNLKRLQSIRCYRGLRHQRGLPVRGQRTITNARTRKGGRKTVGVVRKA
jgi:small subunit ribosomal protein S13